ncbi:hypothetical protein [Marinobacter sp.]|uniref:hypothetical protein n=1 Tax=Marinobacter sp. TaxID=50741 RepID=UPI0035C693BB
MMIKPDGSAALALTLMVGLAVAPALSAAVFPEQALSDEELASLRGGFVLDNFEIRIGLEQVVSIDGETLAVNRLTIPNLNQATNGADVPHTVETVVTGGNGGRGGQTLVSSNSGNGGWLTLIQNSLNGTAIQNSRKLNIELNNFGASFNRLPDSMRDPVLQMLNHH